MPKDDENISLIPDLSVVQPGLEAEPRFSPEQMVRCDECLRANPPIRVECLYCGRALPLNEAANIRVRPRLRPLERWQEGYNNILIETPDDGLSDQSHLEAASLLRLDPDSLKQIILAPKPLPLARTAEHAEAVVIEQGLSSLGLQTMIVSDHDLALGTSPPRRLRSLELRENDFVAHQTSGLEALPIEWTAVTLIVSGRLFARQVELKERKRRGASEREILDAHETSSDELILDIYTGDRNGGWRIMANNFDFSCLGNRKTLLASENFSTLTGVIRNHAARAAYNDSYNSLRRVLELVWHSEQATEARGWQRGRMGKYSTSEVTVTNNEPQFTRYSRLCHVLKVGSTDNC